MNGSKLLNSGERLGAANLLRLVRLALKEENVKGLRYAVTKNQQEIVLRLYGSEVDRFLAAEAIEKHTSRRPTLPRRRPV